MARNNKAAGNSSVRPRRHTGSDPTATIITTPIIAAPIAAAIIAAAVTGTAHRDVASGAAHRRTAIRAARCGTAVRAAHRCTTHGPAVGRTAPGSAHSPPAKSGRPGRCD